jgi:hypothetical protein
VPQDMPGFADCGDFVALHDTAPAAVLRALHVQ